MEVLWSGTIHCIAISRNDIYLVIAVPVNIWLWFHRYVDDLLEHLIKLLKQFIGILSIILLESDFLLPSPPRVSCCYVIDRQPNENAFIGWVRWLKSSSVFFLRHSYFYFIILFYFFKASSCVLYQSAVQHNASSFPTGHSIGMTFALYTFSLPLEFLYSCQ